MAVPLPAATRVSVLSELVRLAEHPGRSTIPTRILEAVRQREEWAARRCRPAWPSRTRTGRMPFALGESVIAYGRTASGIPFGAPHGALTDIFFLVCCRDDSTHLRVLARLSRLLLRPGFIDDLRAAETAAEPGN